MPKEEPYLRCVSEELALADLADNVDSGNE